MTFWIDGTVHAPIERPDGSTVLDVAPLPIAELAPQLTPGAVVPPSGFAPAPQAVALEDLEGEEKLRRDPAAPFDTSSTLMMAYVAGYGSRGPRQPFNVTTVSGPQSSLPTSSNSTSRPNLPQDPYQLVQVVLYPQHGANPIPMARAQWDIIRAAGVVPIPGVSLPLVLPILLLVGGGLLFRTNKSGRQVGIASLIIEAMSTLALIARTQYVLNGLDRWIGPVFGIARLATVFSPTQC